MSLVQDANRKLKQLGIDGEIQRSSRPNKKLMLLTASGKRIHFGAKGSHTFLEGATNQKKQAYRARHSKIKLADGRLAHKVRNTPAYLSWNILW